MPRGTHLEAGAKGAGTAYARFRPGKGAPADQDGEAEKPDDVEAVKADLSAAKKTVLKQVATAPLLAAFASKAKVSVNPARTGVDQHGQPKANRQRLASTRYHGMIQAWDGATGKVKCHEPVWCPETRKALTELAFEAGDTLPRDLLLEEGNEVTFFAFWTTSGYGAESIMVYRGTMLGEDSAKEKDHTAVVPGAWKAGKNDKGWQSWKGGSAADEWASTGSWKGADDWGGKGSWKGADDWGGKGSWKGADDWGGKGSWKGGSGAAAWGGKGKAHGPYW